MVGFEWINDIVQVIFSFVPRILIVRATHGGLKWVLGSRVKELKPGIYFWWPLTTEICVLPTARQTLNTRTQALMSNDLKEVVAGGVVVYSIHDIVMAIGQRNWDVDTTVKDITQAAIVEVITKWGIQDLMNNISGKVKEELTQTCRKELRQFGVYVHKVALTDYSTCKAFNVMGTGGTIPVAEEEE